MRQKQCSYGKFCKSGEEGNGWCSEVTCAGMKCKECGSPLTWHAGTDHDWWECVACKKNQRKKSIGINKNKPPPLRMEGAFLKYYKNNV